MSDLKEFKLPDIGEGLTEADILGWRVAVGDTVEVNQILVEVETAKAAVELPSPWAGVVTALHVNEGDTVDVGRAIIAIDVAPGATASADASAAAGAAQAADTSTDTGTDTGTDAYGVMGEGAPPKRQPVLVGYGPRDEVAGRRRRRNGTPAAAAAAEPPVEPPAAPSAASAFAVPPASAPVTPAPVTPAPRRSGVEHPHRVLAKPPVRKLAKSLGVDLTTVAPTGPNGTVSRDDVQQAASGSPTSAAAPRPAGSRETRIPIKGVRKHTAAAMVASAFTAPHVTEFVTIDVTETMALRDRVAARREFRDIKVSPLLFVAKAVILAAQKTPEINATWDDAAGEIVLKHYVNLGIAAATDRGLIVPNIKDADQLSLRDLALAVGQLTETARAGRTSPADMSGGSITITNVGVFGVDTGTPILNPGESGIVAFGAIRRMPWVIAGPDGVETIQPRWVTQLAVSFDHRIVDGQQGSQFLSDVASVLTDPGLSLL